VPHNRSFADFVELSDQVIVERVSIRIYSSFIPYKTGALAHALRPVFMRERSGGTETVITTQSRLVAARPSGRNGRPGIFGLLRGMTLRFIDFIILISALVTAGSTFAMAVEIIVGWDEAVPVVEQALDDTGLTEYLPRQTGEAPAAAE
jgi:hypothetical protein